MSTTATAVIDPPEFAPGRTALELDKLGIAIVDVDWGDADIELFLVRQRRGEIPDDRHPPNRKASFKLKATGSSAIPLAESAYRLQQKVGILQDEGGWLRRDMDIDGGWLQSVAVPVLSADLGGIKGWLMEHQQIANEITLDMTIGPIFYGVNQREGIFVEEVVNRELIWSIKNVAGSAPGLIRCQVTNKNASAALRGIISAIESRDYPGLTTSETTAHLAYECEKLTLLGGSVEEALTGASGGKAVKCAPIAAWQSYLGSEIAGVGKMTHVGPRKVMIRTYLPSPGETLFMLEYRVGGGPWEQGPIVEAEENGPGFQILDFGECRIENVLLGNQRWEFRVAAKSKYASASGVTTVWFDRCWVLPCEQLITLSRGMSVATPSSFTVRDVLEYGTAGENFANGTRTDDNGNKYLVLTGSDADDFKTTNGPLMRNNSEDSGGPFL